MESQLEFPQSSILTPYNYFEWKPKIQLHLRIRGLFRITMETEVEPTSAIEKSRYFNRMDEAFGILCLSISPELLFHVESCSTPNEVWKILERLFGKQDEIWQSFLFSLGHFDEDISHAPVDELVTKFPSPLIDEYVDETYAEAKADGHPEWEAALDEELCSPLFNGNLLRSSASASSKLLLENIEVQKSFLIFAADSPPVSKFAEKKAEDPIKVEPEIEFGKLTGLKSVEAMSPAAGLSSLASEPNVVISKPLKIESSSIKEGDGSSLSTQVRTDLGMENGSSSQTTGSGARCQGSKRPRKAQLKKVMYVPAAGGSNRPSGDGIHPDLWAWRKYGQKPIKGSSYPRGYYRCSSSKGFLARKQVERSRSDPSILVITYTSEHNCPMAVKPLNAPPPLDIDSVGHSSIPCVGRRKPFIFLYALKSASDDGQPFPFQVGDLQRPSLPNNCNSYSSSIWLFGVNLQRSPSKSLRGKNGRRRSENGMQRLRDIDRSLMCGVDYYLGVRLRYFKKSEDYLSLKVESLVALGKYKAAYNFMQTCSKSMKKPNVVIFRQMCTKYYDNGESIVGITGKLEIPFSEPVADFMGAVEIKMKNNGCGRGMFATDSIKAGEVLLISKALAVCNKHYSSAMFDPLEHRLFRNVAMAISAKGDRALQHFLSHDQENFKPRIPNMPEFIQEESAWGTCYTLETTSQNSKLKVLKVNVREICQKMSGIQILNIIKRIAFDDRSPAVMEESVRLSKAMSAYKKRRSFFGVWILPSFINHSCAPNASRINVGRDIMRIHATRDIKPGEEITIPYFDVAVPCIYRKSHERGFDCLCEMQVREMYYSYKYRLLTSASRLYVSRSFDSCEIVSG